MEWREFLSGRRPREDLYETFPPDNRSDYEPTLLNNGSVLAAARVAARLLFVVAKRGGSRLDPAPLERLIDLLDEALPETAAPHCDEEAARILDWLETAETLPPEERDHERLPPELDLMLGADIESRISVAEFAIDQDHDLELEYFDEETNTWPRVRCEPQAVHQPGEAFDQPMIEAKGSDEQTLHLPVRSIRWLMPVRKTPEPTGPPLREQMGEVLDFPTDRLTGPDDPEGDEQ